MVLEMVWTWTHPKVLAKEVDVQFRCSVVRAPLMLQSALEAACTLPGSSNFPQHLMFRHVALQTVSLIGYVLSFFHIPALLCEGRGQTDWWYQAAKNKCLENTVVRAEMDMISSNRST
jgi:hypothetical protein